MTGSRNVETCTLAICLTEINEIIFSITARLSALYCLTIYVSYMYIFEENAYKRLIYGLIFRLV